MWATVLIASLSTFALKVFGYFLPDSLVTNQTSKKIIAVLPIGLLSGLIAIQLFTTKTSFTYDGRIVGAISAVALLLFRAPFIIVISLSALITAVGRYFDVWL
jgi:branched-subunit amino acid transport protein AzlD